MVFQPMLGEQVIQDYGYFPYLNEKLIFCSHGVGTVNGFLKFMHIPVCEKQSIHMIMSPNLGAVA